MSNWSLTIQNRLTHVLRAINNFLCTYLQLRQHKNVASVYEYDLPSQLPTPDVQHEISDRKTTTISLTTQGQLSRDLHIIFFFIYTLSCNLLAMPRAYTSVPSALYHSVMPDAQNESLNRQFQINCNYHLEIQNQFTHELRTTNYFLCTTPTVATFKTYCMYVR